MFTSINSTSFTLFDSNNVLVFRSRKSYKRIDNDKNYDIIETEKLILYVVLLTCMFLFDFNINFVHL